MIEYNRNNISLAKTLRKNMTPWERKLWYEYLRNYKIRFQRQKAIGDYIVDFYCAKARLVIELDGGNHYEKDKTERDKIRTEKLEEKGLTVIRFSNRDVYENFHGVCQYIDNIVKMSLPQPPQAAAPSSEGG